MRALALRSFGGRRKKRARIECLCGATSEDGSYAGGRVLQE